jgi:hypothetical protein
LLRIFHDLSLRICAPLYAQSLTWLRLATFCGFGLFFLGTRLSPRRCPGSPVAEGEQARRLPFVEHAPDLPGLLLRTGAGEWPGDPQGAIMREAMTCRGKHH